MKNTKKKINKNRTERFLNEFPIILLLQHNNFTVKDWLYFKQKITELNEKGSADSQTNIEFLSIKNSVFKKSLVDRIKSSEKKIIEYKTIEALCQGPNFILGCQNHTDLISIWNVINSSPKLLFISCFHKNEFFNHLDLEIYLKTDFSIYNSFLHHLDKKTEFYQCLHSSLQLYPLILVQQHFLNVLHFFKEMKKN